MYHSFVYIEPLILNDTRDLARNSFSFKCVYLRASRHCESIPSSHPHSRLLIGEVSERVSAEESGKTSPRTRESNHDLKRNILYNKFDLTRAPRMNIVFPVTK